jgi:hypothetical protein
VTKASTKSRISPDVEALMKSMLKMATDTKSTATVEEKLKILDRALKLEAIKAKVSSPNWGSGFRDGDEDE